MPTPLLCLVPSYKPLSGTFTIAYNHPKYAAITFPFCPTCFQEQPLFTIPQPSSATLRIPLHGDEVASNSLAESSSRLNLQDQRWNVARIIQRIRITCSASCLDRMSTCGFNGGGERLLISRDFATSVRTTPAQCTWSPEGWRFVDVSIRFATRRAFFEWE